MFDINAVPNNRNTYLPNVIQIPSALEITAISQAFPMVVTTSPNSVQDNTYIAGQTVTFQIPYAYGMWQLNGMTLPISSVNGTLLSFNIDSTNFDAFSVPAGGTQPASLAPSGSRNLQYNNQTNQVGFQSLNNIGN